MKKYIDRKKGNILYKKGLWGAEKNKQQSSVSEQTQAEGTTGNVVIFPTRKAPEEDIQYSAKDLLMNYGAMAGLAIVFGGVFYFNINTTEDFKKGRSLAGKKDQVLQNAIMEDLNFGNRNLSSFQEIDPLSHQEDMILEKKEKFELTILSSYRVDFNPNGLVQKIQLKSEKPPLYISDISKWIRSHSLFFPKNLSFVGKKNQNLDQIIIFQKMDQMFYFKFNKENQLISMVVSEEK